MNIGSKIFLFFVVFSFYQNTFAYTCPSYLFSTDLEIGSTHRDVKVMQEILNLDKRTRVADTGPGSRGQETEYFGVATREALKRFQALFIEYVGIANGKFGTRTRTTMNAVCKGSYFAGEGVVTKVPTDKKSPLVALAGPETADISAPFRIYIGADEPIMTPDLAGLIIQNATAGDIRKISSTTYSFLVTPNTDAQNEITLQFEAESLSDLAGNKNEVATNEWTVILSGGVDTATGTDFTDLLPDISGLLGPTTDCSTVASVDVNDYTNPCYGRVPTTFPNTNPEQPQNEEQKKENQLMQMLQGLMQGLLGKVLGGMQTGGKVGGNAACGCTGVPTASYSPVGGGIGGRNIITGILGTGGNYVGRQSGPPPICGARIRKGPKDPCSGIPGPHTSSCCGILVDVTLQPVTGTLAPSPTGMFNN